MIEIVRAKDIDERFYIGRNFNGGIEKVRSTVSDILSNVKTRGDAALQDYAAQFDVASPKCLEIAKDDLEATAEKMKKENAELYDAICYSRDLALEFALKQKACFTDFETEIRPGVFTGQKNIAVDRAGVYVPAGRFALVSTVIMTVTPAIAAGVKEIFLCTPPRVHPKDKAKAAASSLGTVGKPFVGGRPYADENILACAHICGVTRAFATGGAQSVAAMAYGTQSIPCVDVIVGPGNAYVAEAKRMVYGAVGIDMVAGPTEVFIIADSSANAEWVAADLLAQAEHDVVAQPVLATCDTDFAKKVSAEIEKQLEALPTKSIAQKSINECGKIIITESLEEAAALANKKAPEHLELAMKDGPERDKIASLVHNYGSLFIGHISAEVLGDYAAGLNHTLPTGASARFTGGLSVRSFLKTVTTLRVQEKSSGLVLSAKAAGVLGDAEGLAAHAKAARLRLNT